MRYAVIDIGSNSVRLVIYETHGQDFKILFKHKIIAGLAGYVKNGRLKEKGIDRAISALTEFKDITENFAVEDTFVFATASLRNIVNTDRAVAKIFEKTGYPVQVISGEEEAHLGYIGAVYKRRQGAAPVVDIGGASTEITLLGENGKLNGASYPAGSLKLYSDCVKGVLPGKKSVKKIEERVAEIVDFSAVNGNKADEIICVGGSCRGVFKIARYVLNLPANTDTLTRRQFDALCKRLLVCDKKAYKIILKTLPERVHTIIPGLIILKYIVEKLNVEKLYVSANGVREGYLCKNVLNSQQTNTYTLKTEN